MLAYHYGSYVFTYNVWNYTIIWQINTAGFIGTQTELPNLLGDWLVAEWFKASVLLQSVPGLKPLLLSYPSLHKLYLDTEYYQVILNPHIVRKYTRKSMWTRLMIQKSD